MDFSWTLSIPRSNICPVKVQNSLERKLKEGLEPLHIEVINESPNHSVPEGSESHFRVVLVSEKFKDLSVVQRHQMVYGLLKEELAGPVHAFSQHTFTPEEWVKKGHSLPDSPPCLGGSKDKKPL